MYSSAIRAHRVLGDPQKMKKPSAHKSSIPRECGVCQKPLSKYNKGPNCYAHTETKYPRVRGHVPD